MRRLTEHERAALREHGPEGEHVPDHVFEELERLGWGSSVPSPRPDDPVDPATGKRLVEFLWTVTPSGRRALALDDAARRLEALEGRPR